VKHLFQSWQAFTAACRSASHILLLADYDGTLTPIVGRPRDAVLSTRVREILTTLAGKPMYSVGVISGRSITELKSLVAIEGIYYAGNHGLEIEGPGLRYISPLAESARMTIKDLAEQMATELADVDGVIVQDKGMSLSIHYRLVRKEKESTVADVVRRLTTPLCEGGKIKLFTGKKVWEIRPPVDWDKGKAVEAIEREIKAMLKIERLLTIYLGDDNTDEDAFRVVHPPGGWSIFVGEENQTSAAYYFLNSTAEVETFLTRLHELE
jgi:trehalose 6-phosphate phosphatase